MLSKVLCWITAPPGRHLPATPALRRILLVVLFAVLGASLTTASPAASLSDALPSPLAKWFAGKGEGISPPGGRFLPPEEAFSFSYPEISASDTLTLRWRIADGYYLYRDRFRFESVEKLRVSLGEARIPPGIVREEPDGSGQVALLSGDGVITLPLIFGNASAVGGGNSGKGVLEFIVGYQGCAEAGFCYPPMSRSFRVALPVGGLGEGE